MFIADRSSGRPPWSIFARARGLTMRSSLGYQVLGYILLMSAALAIVSTGIHLMTFVSQEKSAILKTFETVEPVIVASLDTALARNDAILTAQLLSGALKVGGVKVIRLTDAQGDDHAYGAVARSDLRLRSYTLGPARQATLQIGLGFDSAYDRLGAHATTTLLAELAKVLVIAMSIVWVFERLAARRLRLLADQVQYGAWRMPGAELTLDRSGSVLPDEIDRIIETLEGMWTDARSAYETLAREKLRADRLNHSLSTAQMEQGELSTALSHDLITPVNTFQVLLDELQAEFALQSPQADRDELINDMRATAERMRKQIQSVVHYSTLLTQPAQAVRTDLEDVLRRCKADLMKAFALEPDQITWGPLVSVMGDPDELALLFKAILRNAVIYAHPDHVIFIHVGQVASKKETGRCIEITDNGRGIPKKHHKTVFGLFARLHTYTDIPGAGIGLALCRRIMTRHLGTISLQSEPGIGTTITLCFPEGDPDA